MEKMLRNYIKQVEQGLHHQMTLENKKKFQDELLIHIGFFQHERFIHLIVTVTFAILTMIATSLCFFVPGLSVFLLTGLFLSLLIPYIRHYYILENGVQKLYSYYDNLNASRV